MAKLWGEQSAEIQKLCPCRLKYRNRVYVNHRTLYVVYRQINTVAEVLWVFCGIFICVADSGDNDLEAKQIWNSCHDSIAMI